MKSWVFVFFPTTDERKQQQLSNFFAEGAVVLLLSLIGMIIYSHYFNISVVNALLIPVAIFLIYIAIRHTVSGIEFANVATDQSYKKELKVIFIRIATFAALMSGYLLVFRPAKWIEGVLLVLITGLVWFLSGFISLKRSYRKNKDLL